jgi:hypothetical protein
MIIYINSPFVQKVVQENNLVQTLPVFGDYDRAGGKVVSGRVTLDPSCLQSGRLSINVGSFNIADHNLILQ